MKRKAFVVDTNVLVVANGRDTHADKKCVGKSIEALETVRDAGIIVLDDQNAILREYANYCHYSGQPGAGDAFLRWAWRNQAVAEACERVRITPKAGKPEDYEEFPDDPALKGFDRNDRKFVAVARESRNKPKILNATDTDWWEFRDPLRRHGIEVEFLCRHMMRNS
jgi:hypothetical protein